MVKKYWCLILVIVLGLVLLSKVLPHRNSLPNVPVREPGEIVNELDTNDDGNIDVWFFTDQDTVPVRMIRDTDFDGKPDSWDHFKNGQTFLAQEDRDHDGRIDFIILDIYDMEENNIRQVLLLLEEGNLFVAAEDTGWLKCGTTIPHP